MTRASGGRGGEVEVATPTRYGGKNGEKPKEQKREREKKRVGIGEKRHGYFALNAFRSISFVHSALKRVHKRARVSFGRSSLFRCLAVPRWIRQNRSTVKNKKGPKAWMRRRRRRRKGLAELPPREREEKTRRNETLPNAVFSPGEKRTAAPTRASQLCPLSSLIHRVISFPLQPVLFFSLSLSFSRGGFDFV